MIVRHTSILLMPLLVVGCATQRPVPLPTPTSLSAVIAPVVPTKFVETPYEVRGYREAANPSVRHEAHAVYRRTLVPLTASDPLATVPRTSYPPASIAPLPDSDELAAELATQKKITGDLRLMQASMAETEQRMQTQYAMLVRQSAETLKVREQLEAERARVRAASPVGTGATPAGATASNAAEVKW